MLSISAISFPLLLDRDVGAAVAMHTSLRVMAANPLPTALWGLIVAALLVIGSIPFRRMQHIKDMARRTIETGLATPAQLIETDRGNRPD